MAFFKRQKSLTPGILLALLLIVLPVSSVRAQYAVLQGDEPRIRAILYTKENPRALIYHNSQDRKSVV